MGLDLDGFQRGVSVSCQQRRQGAERRPLAVARGKSGGRVFAGGWRGEGAQVLHAGKEERRPPFTHFQP